MAWKPFSAEVIELDTQLQRLHREGRVSDALNLINAALEKAHRDGPSNMTFEAFEAMLEARSDPA